MQRGKITASHCACSTQSANLPSWFSSNISSLLRAYSGKAENGIFRSSPSKGEGTTDAICPPAGTALGAPAEIYTFWFAVPAAAGKTMLLDTACGSCPKLSAATAMEVSPGSSGWVGMTPAVDAARAPPSTMGLVGSVFPLPGSNSSQRAMNRLLFSLRGENSVPR